MTSQHFGAVSGLSSQGRRVRQHQLGARWNQHLGDLLRVATRDPAATLFIDENLLSPLDGYTIPSPEFGGPSHPFVTIRASLSPHGQEGTVLHEAAHWRLGHVQDVLQREAVEEDASARIDVVRAPFEREANEYAIHEILEDPDVRALLVTSIVDVREFLLEDFRRFGGRNELERPG